MDGKMRIHMKLFYVDFESLNLSGVDNNKNELKPDFHYKGDGQSSGCKIVRGHVEQVGEKLHLHKCGEGICMSFYDIPAVFSNDLANTDCINLFNQDPMFLINTIEQKLQET
ncbi:hypothetical protein RF11_15859 [Thelohanellus kitauei]|uniref:Uncharacterized protein n=1 Tax=Thelohanellus kitauei TaxID=669202 RepID=A0A0C2N1P3_THEKT|nr:hypothetical protein RF11_15859 [Thelohanellus kitauei]